MTTSGFFTIDEVVDATGFDRRTIAYYVQQGLLPKVGRRGRLSRYPQDVVNRLLFIRRLREAEESGERPVPMTLAEIRNAFDRIPADELAMVARGDVPVSAINRLLDPPEEALAETGASGPPPDEWRAALRSPPDLASRANRMNLMLDETDEPDLFIPRMKRDTGLGASRYRVAEDAAFDSDEEPEGAASMGPPAGYGESLADSGPDDDLDAMLTRLCRLTAHRPPRAGAAATWAKIAITPGLELAAHDADLATRTLLERIAALLRRRLAESRNRR